MDAVVPSAGAEGESRIELEAGVGEQPQRGDPFELVEGPRSDTLIVPEVLLTVVALMVDVETDRERGQSTMGRRVAVLDSGAAGATVELDESEGDPVVERSVEPVAHEEQLVPSAEPTAVGQPQLTLFRFFSQILAAAERRIGRAISRCQGDIACRIRYQPSERVGKTAGVFGLRRARVVERQCELGTSGRPVAEARIQYRVARLAVKAVPVGTEGPEVRHVVGPVHGPRRFDVVLLVETIVVEAAAQQPDLGS